MVESAETNVLKEEASVDQPSADKASSMRSGKSEVSVRSDVSARFKAALRAKLHKMPDI